MKICARCRKEISVDRRVSRRETCPHCGAWLHTCVNCRFYSPGRHNDCKESGTDPVRDKESSNFCDFFEFKESRAGPSPTGENPSGGSSSAEQRRQSARDAFDKLFGES
jgi:predicted RNA-binding Zn-ribbon protein involved in translation (DUF1610 family)